MVVDETGTATNRAARYGWGRRGERVIGHAPHRWWHTSTFVAGPTIEGFIAPPVFEGAMDAATSETWVERSPVPALPKRAVVLIDTSARTSGRGGAS